jgi:hypothetical protein
MSGSTSFSGIAHDCPGVPRSPWIIRFDYSRRKLEKYVASLPEEAAQKFAATVKWMREVLAKEAPELLNGPPYRQYNS